MKINFTKLEIFNFLSFKSETFDFDANKGMNLICGKNNDIPGAKNGSGKSSLSFALIYCLFGQLPNTIKNENIHNRFTGEKEVRVICYFNVDKIQYKVITGLNKHSQAYCNLFQYNKDGTETDITKSSIVETRSFLEQEIIHCDLPIFLRTIYLSSDQTYNFFRLKKNEKKDFIEKLFDISIFGDMYSSIHKDILGYDKQILGYQNQLLILNKSDSDYLNCVDEYEKNTKLKLATLNQNLTDFQNKCDTLKTTLHNTKTVGVDKYETTLNKLDDMTRLLNNNITTLNNEYSKYEILIQKSKSTVDQKQKIIDKHTELLNKLCDDCSVIFKDYYNIDKYLEEIKSAKNIIEDNKVKQSQILEKKQKIQTKLSEISTKGKLIETKITQLTEEYNKINRELGQAEAKLNNIASEIETTKNSTNPYIKLYESNKQKIGTTTDSLNKISEHYKYLKFAENIVAQDTIRKFIIKDLVGLLNNKIKTYLTKVGSKYTVVFDSDMNYDFITESGSCEYNNFSAGERMRLAIASSFAFRSFMAIRNNISSNILILDEFIDANIDNLAIEGIVEILNDFVKIDKQNIYLISHRQGDIDNSIFDNIIQIQKTENISKICYLENEK